MKRIRVYFRTTPSGPAPSGAVYTGRNWYDAFPELDLTWALGNGGVEATMAECRCLVLDDGSVVPLHLLAAPGSGPVVELFLHLLVDG